NPSPATPAMMSAASDNAQTATTASTCWRRMPCLSTNTFCAPIAMMRDRPSPSPARNEITSRRYAAALVRTSDQIFSHISVAYMAGISAELALTVAAIVDGGSLDAAARTLNITPSAVSQRLKTLEQQLGQVLIVRAKPALATSA